MPLHVNHTIIPFVLKPQEPTRAMSRRLITLLAEFPEHPVLAQLMAIASRCLGLPAATTPLKTALTGLELLLARAQVGLGSSLVAQSRADGQLKVLLARAQVGVGSSSGSSLLWK